MEDITAEYTTDQLTAPAELRVRPKVTVAAKTDLGRVRDNNEDKFEFFMPETERELATKGLIFVVCDGMGGHEAGQIASELTAKTFIDVYLNHPAAEPEQALRAAVVAANRFVLDVARSVPSRKGMGTTLSALILLQDRGYFAHVGDSRIYLLRRCELTQLTLDHTWIEEAVARQMMSRQEAEAHPYRHVLTRAIGADGDVAADVESFPIEEGDVFMLCSDGLTNHVDDEGIAQALQGAPSSAAWKLVGQALAGGGSDNCTVLIVRLDGLETVAND
jgi:PPM family protein phosphatase